jgi:hypothetical protein
MSHISLVTLATAMRAKTARPEQPVALKTQWNSGLGRVFAVAMVFAGGMYAISASLIGMM